jgi:tRNA dimethylallyltransferase
MTPRHEPHFFVIAGPTACGKSEFAVRVAELSGGEIIGADAFQIYQGLDLLTAKPSHELRERAVHHLIGEVPLAENFDVARFAELANARIAEVLGRGKVPIVCGGTGLYVRALLRGLADLPRADAALRAELEAQSLEELLARLAKLDPLSAAQIDRQNRRRVVRAVEVCVLTSRPFSAFRQEWAAAAPEARGVFLHRDRGELQSCIAARTARMFACGVEEEVRAVPAIGTTAAQAIGFRTIQALLAGEIGRDECQRTIIMATESYAKRQMTWFRREPALEPVALSNATDLENLAASVSHRLATMFRS